MNIPASIIQDKYVNSLLPVRIAITTPPTKLAYTDGEAIDITGMVVTAYNSDDSVWGIIPLNELTIVPVVAVSPDEFEVINPTVDGETYDLTLRIKEIEAGSKFVTSNGYTVSFNQTMLTTFIDNDFYGAASYDISDGVWFRTSGGGSSPAIHISTIDDKTAYYGTMGSEKSSGLKDDGIVPISEIRGSLPSLAKRSWLIVYGERLGDGTVTITWNNGVEDLTDTFDITVSE